MNNSLVKAFMELMDRYGFQGTDKMTGFLMLIGIALGILISCLLIGKVREIILGKCDKRIEEEIKSMEWLKGLGG